MRISRFFATGARTFFACDDGVSGREPWVYDPATGSTAFVLPYGVGCAGSAGVPEIGAAGAPTLGSAGFAITLSHALANTIALQVASAGSSNISLGSCRLLLDFPLIPWTTVATDASGFAIASLPIPVDPSLAGANLFCQWGVVDPVGAILGSIAASNGLQIQLGN